MSATGSGVFEALRFARYSASSRLDIVPLRQRRLGRGMRLLGPLQLGAGDLDAAHQPPAPLLGGALGRGRRRRALRLLLRAVGRLQRQTGERLESRRLERALQTALAQPVAGFGVGGRRLQAGRDLRQRLLARPVGAGRLQQLVNRRRDVATGGIDAVALAGLQGLAQLVPAPVSRAMAFGSLRARALSASAERVGRRSALTAAASSRCLSLASERASASRAATNSAPGRP